METAEFDAWLSKRLSDLGTDEAMFGPYIKTILEGDEELSQKIEDLDGLLLDLGIAGSDGEFRSELMSRWNQSQAKDKGAIAIVGAVSLASTSLSLDAAGSNGVDPHASASATLDRQFERILHLAEQDTASAVGKERSKDDEDAVALRAHILQQYQGDDSESDHEEEKECTKRKGKGHGHDPSDSLERNTNAQRVQDAQKEVRERAKAEAAKKREKDKEDRANQKKSAEEKKEKAKKKSAKVERKR